MRKIICTLCILAALAAMVLPCCAAGIDLSTLSWEELIELRNAVTQEMFTREEWEKVEVPQGVWIVGEDIPAGTWIVTCAAAKYTTITWGDKLSDNGHAIDYNSTVHDHQIILNPDGSLYKSGDATSYTFDAIDGMYIVIDNGSAFFSPYIGKPKLNFK